MKLKQLLPFALLTVLLPLGSCSEDDGYVGITDDTPPVTEVPDVVTPENVRSYMADPGATDETVALFYNLWKQQKTKFLVGQQDAFNSFYQDATGDSDIKKATGSDPSLLGSDFMFITDDKNMGDSPEQWYQQQEAKITADSKAAYDKGMVNTFCWHFREPFNGVSFYAEDIDDTDLYAAFPSIMPGGVNHDYYKGKLDKIADVLNNLKGTDGKLIPVIFRPFHEFDGSWFWWGANYCTPEQYKAVWQFTVEYLRDTKGVHNVLYAYSPDNSYTTETQYLTRYPGDDYTDLLGMDNYGDFANGSTTGVTTANKKLIMLSTLAQNKVKIAAMTESGYRVTADTPPIAEFFSNNIFRAMTDAEVQLAYVMFWNNNLDGYYVPPAGQSNTPDFVTFTQKPEVLLQNNMPNMYKISN
jgi:mannan endo-1,4-beta-mannosidase